MLKVLGFVFLCDVFYSLHPSLSIPIEMVAVLGSFVLSHLEMVPFTGRPSGYFEKDHLGTY